MFRRRKGIKFFGLITIFLGIYFIMRSPFYTEVITHKARKRIELGREPWMTIFVHGSFASILGLLSVYQVMQDEVDGTYYKKVVNKMRKDPFFYTDQPLLKRGLIKINPTFDLARVHNNKFAAYPFCQAYQLLTEYAKPDKEENFYYVFGWSGLISQKRRCLEAIRFYNVVSEELEKYRKNGIYPKVRILTHSHGGNVIAYLGAIDKVLWLREGVGNGTSPLEVERKKILSENASVTKKGDVEDFVREREVILQMVQKKLASLPTRRGAKRKMGQKRWTYTPKNRGFMVEELILWGMPVQPETDHLFASSVFKKVYHFYSDEDLVQRVDWVSTKKGYSDRRFSGARLGLSGKMVSESNYSAGGIIPLVQSRVMVERDAKGIQKVQKQDKELKQQGEESFWSILFSGGSLVTPVSGDPTHKELWFFCWHDEKSSDRKFILSPLPVALFSPLLIQLIEQNPGLNDVDVNICAKDNEIEFCLLRHECAIKETECCIKKSFLKSLEKQLEPWRTKKISYSNLLNLIGRYVGS